MFNRMVTEVGDVRISTARPYGALVCYGVYETAIIYDNGEVAVLEGYDTLEDAIKGHCKYSLMTEKELENLPTIG